MNESFTMGPEALISYRAFRRQFVNDLTDRDVVLRFSGRHRVSRGETISAGRQAISAFRHEVAMRARDLLLASSNNEAFVRRALCLNPTSPLWPSAWAITAQIALFFFPTSVAERRARRMLGLARSLDGRKFLFKHFVRRTLPGRDPYYDEAFDYAFRHFVEIRSGEDVRFLDHMEFDLLKVAHGLGLKTVADVRHALPFDGTRQKSRLLLLLVSEGVIRSTEELPWAGKSNSWTPHRPTDDEEIRALRNTVRCLLKHGVGREQVAGILRFPLWGMDSDQLAENLRFLEKAPIADLSSLLEQLGDRLWRTPTATWRYVVEIIGARAVPDIARFKLLLNSPNALSEEIANELIFRGASLDDLVGCQHLLSELRPDKDGSPSFVDKLQWLAAPPHSLNIGTLSQCSTYLTGNGDLAAFLQVLTKRGFVGATAVLEFQCCFGKTSAASLDRCLTMLEAKGQGEPLAQVAVWALTAGQGGYFDAYDYLVLKFHIDRLESLQRASKLVPLGVPLLRYLVEERGLRTLSHLREWYYNKVRGIDRYRSWADYDAMDKVLVDDAFDRNQFNHLEANQAVVSTIVRQRVELLLGAWPWQGDETEKQAHQEASQALARSIRDELLPLLPIVLRRTGGVLLPTIFERDGSDDAERSLERNLSKLTPLLTNLLAGGGPSGSILTPLEVDAVALIYRTPAETVRSRWSQLLGREHDMQTLKLRTRYPMEWQQAHWCLRKRLDRSGYSPLLKAAQFSEVFGQGSDCDMFTACQRLSPKQLWTNVQSSNLDTLALHMGSLLAVVREDAEVMRWVREGFEALACVDEDSLEAYQRLGALVNFFDVVLPDALAAHTERYIAGLSEVDAGHWASRLGPRVEAETGRAQLRTMLQRTRDKVLPMYLTWAKRQQKRYKRDSNVALKAQQMVAVATKHPAAFFAKSAVQLCTAGNIEMWREDRLFHLVVFDEEGMRMAGMALTYVQSLPELDSTRRSLVIRAINPTDEMMSGHAAASIVESFVNVAVQVAQDNDLACVAFPELTGMHLMSNREPIETYIKERFVKRAVKSVHSGDDVEALSLADSPQLEQATFYAYENGREPVGALYVIWRSAHVGVEKLLPIE